MIPPGFHRVSKREPCPICGRPNWCIISDDGSEAACPRTKSDRKFGKAGYLHKIDGVKREPVPSFAKQSAAEKFMDFPAIWQRYMVETTTPMLAALADELGVGRESLRKLNAAWASNHHAWAFPMRDSGNAMIGIRFRSDRGKWALEGSTSGLFIPQPFSDETNRPQILVAEGPTDTAAISTLGYETIGRPSCQGCEEMIVQIARKRRAAIVIAGNFDSEKERKDGTKFKPGQDGAYQLAARIPGAKVIFPNGQKDFRAYINAGATRAAIELKIKAAPIFRRAS